MNWLSALVVTHVVLTTAGYAGLIVTNAWLLALCRLGAGAVVAALATWRQMVRWFGPILGLGILAGFGLALLMGVELTAAWLVATYVLILLAVGVQAAIMVPWQRRAGAALAAEERPSTRPIATTLAVFCIAYVGILGLMLLRP